MVDKDHSELSIVRQCSLLGLRRSTYYYRPKGESEFNLPVMRLIDEPFLEAPVFGSRQMRRHLRNEGVLVGRRRVRRQMASTRAVQSAFSRFGFLKVVVRDGPKSRSSRRGGFGRHVRRNQSCRGIGRIPQHDPYRWSAERPFQHLLRLQKITRISRTRGRYAFNNFGRRASSYRAELM